MKKKRERLGSLSAGAFCKLVSPLLYPFDGDPMALIGVSIVCTR
jgi:hypothetical protein